MKKRFRDTEAWKYIRTVLEMIALVFGIWLLVQCFEWLGGQVKAETMWVVCSPDDVLLVRESPKKTSAAVSELVPGTEVETSGKVRNGYTKLTGLASESENGWVRSIYLVDEEPEYIGRAATVISKGRLAARRCIGGERVRWLKPGSTVTVWFRTSEWSVTDKGYVQSRYLRVDGEEDD